MDSVLASTVSSDFELVTMLNQASSDHLNKIGYITSTDERCGLLRYGSAIAPFVNRFPKDTELYKLMTTKPDEQAEPSRR